MQIFPLIDTPEDFGEAVPVAITITKPPGCATMVAKLKIIQPEQHRQESDK
jgi:hypothetical protein